MTEIGQLTRTAKGIRDLARSIGLECPDYIKIHRTYAGHSLRGCGAWSWFASDADNRELFGSQWTCQQVLQAERISVGSIEGRRSFDLCVEKP